MYLNKLFAGMYEYEMTSTVTKIDFILNFRLPLQAEQTSAGHDK